MATASKRKTKTVTRKHKTNTPKLIIDNLKKSMRGANAFGIGVKELVLNELDENGEVALLRGNYKKDPAFITAGNGNGMNDSSLQAVLNFGYSNKTNDKKKTGKHGTGSKLLLGLGSEKVRYKQKLTFISKADGHPCYVASTDVQHLINGTQKNAKTEILETDLPDDWQKYFPGRTTGTTVIFTGFDGRNVWSTEKLIEEFSTGRYLTPEALTKVKILKSNGVWSTVPYVPIGTERYDFEFETPILGKISFNIYLDGTSSEDLFICGKHNIMTSLHQMYSYLNKQQKAKLPRSARGLSGHIVMEHVNKKFRDDDSQLKAEFYEEAADEFLDVFALVCEDVAKKQKDIKDQKHLDDHKFYARRLSVLNEQKYGKIELPATQTTHDNTTVSAPGGNPEDKKDTPQVSKPIQIFPSNKRVGINMPFSFMLKDPSGTINLDETTWFVQYPNLLAISKNKGAALLGTANNLVGTTLITAKNQGFEKDISFEVTVYIPKDKEMRIKGPSTLEPGMNVQYSLVDYPDSIDPTKLKWKCNWIVSTLSGVIREDNNDKVNIITNDDCKVGEFILEAKLGRKVLLSRRIKITETVGEKPIKITVNNKPYLLEVGVTFPYTAACDSNIDGIGVIYYNPMTKVMRQSGSPIDKMIHFIGIAALTRQQESGSISVSGMMKALDEFTFDMKNLFFSKNNSKA